MTLNVNGRANPNRWGNTVFSSATFVKQPWLDPVGLEEKLRNDDTLVYLLGNAGAGFTAAANRDAFRRCTLVPSSKRATPSVDLTTSFTIGERRFTLPSPMMFAPTGALGDSSHRDADLDVARGLVRAGVPMILSTQTDAPMKLIAKTLDKESARNGNAAMPRWFQLYASGKYPELNESLVRRAIACGCSAIVWTIDMPSFGSRPKDQVAGKVPFKIQHGMGNLTSDPVFDRLAVAHAAASASLGLSLQPGLVGIGALVAGAPNLLQTLLDNASNGRHKNYLWRLTHPGRALAYASFLTESYGDRDLGMDYVTTLRALAQKLTPAGEARVPVIVKGITDAASALAAIEAGADAIVVSNHGGRHHDGQRAALDVLPEVVDAVRGRVPIFFDSGIRTGEDVYKALALGATATLVSRPVGLAQAVGYAQGGKRIAAAAVDGTLTNMQAGLESTMLRMSRGTVGEINSDDVQLTPPH